MKYANMRICMFSGSGTSRGLGLNPKTVFFYKVLYIQCSKKILEHFVPKKGVPKYGFPIIFSKSDLGVGGRFFH